MILVRSIYVLVFLTTRRKTCRAATTVLVLIHLLYVLLSYAYSRARVIYIYTKHQVRSAGYQNCPSSAPSVFVSATLYRGARNKGTVLAGRGCSCPACVSLGRICSMIRDTSMFRIQKKSSTAATRRMTCNRR